MPKRAATSARAFSIAMSARASARMLRMWSYSSLVIRRSEYSIRTVNYKHFGRLIGHLRRDSTPRMCPPERRPNGYFGMNRCYTTMRAVRTHRTSSSVRVAIQFEMRCISPTTFVARLEPWFSPGRFTQAATVRARCPGWTDHHAVQVHVPRPDGGRLGQVHGPRIALTCWKQTVRTATRASRRSRRTPRTPHVPPAPRRQRPSPHRSRTR